MLLYLPQLNNNYFTGFFHPFVMFAVYTNSHCDTVLRLVPVVPTSNIRHFYGVVFSLISDFCTDFYWVAT